MKISFQNTRSQLHTFIVLITFLLASHFTSKASVLVGCGDFVCEDIILFKSLPHEVELETLVGAYCENLSFSPTSMDQSFIIPNEGIIPYTVYNLITGDSCMANIEMVCGLVCPDEFSAFLELDVDTVQVQPVDFSLRSCYNDEILLPPYEDGVFMEGVYEVAFYSPILDDSCTTELEVNTECYEIVCQNLTRVYYNIMLWPQHVLDNDCPDTTAYLIEIIDENDDVILSGNSIFMDEALHDTLDVRITHLETGNTCTSELRLFDNCLQYAKDTVFLDFTGLDMITVPWDSLFTQPCGHHILDGGYGTGYTPQGGKIIYTEEGHILKNSYQSSFVVFADTRIDGHLSVKIFYENQSLSKVEGFVFQDLEEDCEVDPLLDIGVENMLVYAIGETDTFYNYSGVNGKYSFELPEFYTYDIGLIEFNNFWDFCINESPIYLDEEAEQVDIGLSVDTLCSYLTSYMTIPRFRRCFDNYIYMSYCNLGSDTAYDVTLDFYFDEGLDIDAAAYGFTVIDANHFQLDIGTLAPLECDTLNVIAFVDCDLDFGTELCVEIELGPIPDCNDQQEWSGAALDIQGICDGDSVRFTITNIGDADMSQSQEFIVIEDDIMIIEDNSNLPVGESIEISLPANGSTYRLISNQEPFHPYTDQVSALVKECAEGSVDISTGFANSFVLDELAPYISIECQPVVGSYDPNDKAVTPSGVYENNVIQGDEELEYTIRFENTGTDTAFTVFIRDSLDPNLDLLTFRLAGSSHPVFVDYPSDGRLFFRFININLPDTSVNKLGAQGFVKYTIRPKSNLPLETKIYNSAEIFFDFNSPIITNRVDLQVGEYISTGLNNNTELRSDFISPNPTYAYLNIDVEFDQFIVSNMNGIKLMSGGKASKINVKSLLPGIYLISIFEDDRLIGVDRFVKINLE